MRLRHGLHLAYCTNIHRGESWASTMESLKRYTLAVKENVCPAGPYAIGLRLGMEAAATLADQATRDTFKAWLERNHCYVFTINGFPYGQFHGTKVKEQVYRPDWTTSERVEYTKLLFEILADIAQPWAGGSVSTMPCSFKAFGSGPEREAVMRANLWDCVEYIDRLAQRTGLDLHLGLEPEPLCYLETSDETIQFLERMKADRPGDTRLSKRLGINYDTCHLAIEFEDASAGLARLRDAGVRISKIHLSSALKAVPSPAVRRVLAGFQEEVYLHQVVVRDRNRSLRRYKDLPDALAAEPAEPWQGHEWRIHFHVPLHSRPASFFDPTTDRHQLDLGGSVALRLVDGTQEELLGTLSFLAKNPGICTHLEMETYTWEVLPPELKVRNVADQLVAEYDWTLDRLEDHGFSVEAEPPRDQSGAARPNDV